jgi:hypothetical protein
MTDLGPGLVRVDAAMRAASAEAESLYTRLGPKRIAMPPAPGRWSVAECLIHIKLCTDAYLPLWRGVLSDARSRGLRCEHPLRRDLWGVLLEWFLEPPPKLRFAAPQKFQPVAIPSPEQVLPVFLASQGEVLQVLADAEGLPIDWLDVTSPFSRRLRYSVWSSFCVTAAHHRRHLWQAERVAEALAK